MTIAGQILYEDNHLIALNKLPGQIVQGDKTGGPSSRKSWHRPKPSAA